jgi:hypothetical protein
MAADPYRRQKRQHERDAIMFGWIVVFAKGPNHTAPTSA